ncbi:actin-related protein 6 [Phlebotomus argentipes]|uniref:actin-related protein 6 n=1 Tax=Phlebotomus argentipes TaxID=94469 RepID=UPI002892A674|nr:actin-related protein 6 [Phlebotomus argentipes]
MNTLILDNGAYTAKIGFSQKDSPRIVPNCIMKAKSERRRPFVGDQIEECRDVSGLYYILCFQRGYLVNWDIQKTVWDYMFSAECCGVNYSENPLIVTEPLFNFHSIQEAMSEIFFEEYEFERMFRTTAADMCAFSYLSRSKKQSKPLGCVIIDMGYSFTHIVPFIKGRKQKSAIRRIDIGGKVLTNHMKEIVSYRQLNVMDESYVINQVKEDSCFVSQNFTEDMKIARKRHPDNTIIREYILPDFTSIRRGYLRDFTRNEGDHQVLVLNNERFSIPELFFHPSDIGIQQMGIPEAVLDAVSACPPETAEHLLSNIVVCGGSAQFPGMGARLQREIRALAPEEYNVCVRIAEKPMISAWQGCKKFSQEPDFLKACVTREEFEEEGNRIIIDKFDV